MNFLPVRLREQELENNTLIKSRQKQVSCLIKNFGFSSFCLGNQVQMWVNLLGLSLGF